MGNNEKNQDTVIRPEGKTLSNEDYDNYHRTKRAIFVKWKYGHHSIQIIDASEGTKIMSVHLKNVEMNKVKVNILSQMVQLIVNSFEAKPNPQKI